MFNIKALSLTSGLIFALLALLSMLILGPVLSQQPNFPSINAGTAFLSALATIILAFVEGTVLGAIFGGIYNALERQDATTYTREDTEIYQT